MRSIRLQLRGMPLVMAAALCALMPSAGHAEHPVGSPAWLRAQQGTAASGSTSEQQGSGQGAGMAVQPPIAPPAVAVTDETVPGAASINPLSRMALGELKAFKGRPLFAPSRRPPFSEPVVEQPATTEQPVVAPEGPAPDLRLIGIVAGVDKAVAVLGRPAGGPPISVRVGDQVESWQVHLIAPDRVVLRQGEREQAYRLFASASAAIRAPSETRKRGVPAIPGLSAAEPALEP